MRKPSPVWMQTEEIKAKRLRTVERNRLKRFWESVSVSGADDCWLWAKPFSGRYPRVSMGGSDSEGAHRFSYQIANGEIPPGLLVRHKCDNPKCVNPAHLELGTHADNRADCVRRGRQASGSRQGNSKLNEGQVREIKRRISTGEKLTDIARSFGIGISHASSIKTGRWWRHIA